MKQAFLIPRKGLNVRDEHGLSHVPAGGDLRNLTTYYNRRIKDGDLIVREGNPTEIIAGPPAEVVPPADEKTADEKAADHTKANAPSKGKTR